MDNSIIALAIEALERRKEAIQSEIDALKGAKKAGAKPQARKWSATARKAQRERMKAYWAKKNRAPKASKQPAKPTKSAAGKPKPGPQSAASKPRRRPSVSG